MVFIFLMIIGAASASDNVSDVIETVDDGEVQAIDDVNQDIQEEVLAENNEEDGAAIGTQDIQSYESEDVVDVPLAKSANVDVVGVGDSTNTSKIDVYADGKFVSTFNFTNKNGTYTFAEILEIIDMSDVDMSSFGNFAEIFGMFKDLTVTNESDKTFDFKIDGEVGKVKYNLAFISNLTNIVFDHKIVFPNSNPNQITGKNIEIFCDGKSIKNITFTTRGASNFDFAKLMEMGNLSGLDMSSFKNYMDMFSMFNDTNSSKSFDFKINGEVGKIKYYLIVSSNKTSFVFDYKIYRPVVDVVLTADSLITTAFDAKLDGNIGKYLTITLKDVWGEPLANKMIQVSVNGKILKVMTGKDGVVKLPVSYAKAGTYYYSICFLGDDIYPAAFKVVKVTVLKQKAKLTTAKKTYKVKSKAKKLKATFKTAKGKAIKGKKITFKVKGKTYSAKTNSKGVATVKVKLAKKGKYSVAVKFAGDNTYSAISKKTKLIIK